VKINKKYLHIAIIVIGIIFVSLGAFHTNLWFDESYSVAMANHNFEEIWTIGSSDVHPILYYWMLRIVNLLTGGNILAYRLFSIIPMAILGILGFTHIKKDFGEKVGMLFSFLVFFLPVNIVYSSEIRMYTWAMLFVTIMSIYAYRILKNGTIKNWAIFAIFSLASAYTHYYGLMTAGIINLALFIYFIVKLIKNSKENKETKVYKSNIIKFSVQAIIQIVLYVPWLFAMFNQLNEMADSFWVRVNFNTILEIFEFQFTGNLSDTTYIDTSMAVLFGIIMLIYIITLISKSRKEDKECDIKPAIFALSVYILIILAALIISIVRVPILYARYMLNVTGLFIFFMAFIMAKEKNGYRTIAICSLIVLVSICVNLVCITDNYDKYNKETTNFISERIEDNDIILHGNPGSGFVISTIFSNNKQYFYNQENWNVEKSYKAYEPNMEIIYNLDCLKDYTGRIWVIGAENFKLLEEEFPKAGYNDIEVLEKASFSTGYKSYQYSIALIQKNL